MKAIQKILVTTDLSGFSIAAMDYATFLAEVHGATIYLLYVIESEPNPVFPPSTAHLEKVPRELEEKAKKDLHKFAYWRLKDVGNMVEVVRHGKPHEEIPRFAKENGIDLIVMATHGQTGLAHVLLGSVAEKVVRISSVPVLTVKPHEVRTGFFTERDVEEDLHLKVER